MKKKFFLVLTVVFLSIGANAFTFTGSCGKQATCSPGNLTTEEFQVWITEMNIILCGEISSL